MTGRNLLQAVANTGGECALDENESRFYTAANLSLLQLARALPRESTLTVAGEDGEDYFTDYHLDTLCHDFAAFAPVPVFLADTPLQPGRDFVIEGATLRVARGKNGLLRIRYHKRPHPLQIDGLDDAVDVSPEAEHLLILLCSAYFWMGEDDGIAAECRSLYYTELGELLRSRRTHATSRIITRNGWDKG